MNHELPVGIAGGVAFPVGGIRESGNAGAFVSRWTIDKASFEVLQVEDLIPNTTSLFLSDNDPGTHLGKVFRYSIASDSLEIVMKHDPLRFGDLGIPAAAPYNQDEESSGIIPVYDILGAGWIICDVQAHYGLGGELVEGGQVLAVRLPPGLEK